jgi:hypothetical protein
VVCGEIIRTHLLRPTWHFVSSNDVHWMLELTAPQIKAAMKSRNKQLELTDGVFQKSNRIIEKTLTGGKHLHREELMAEIIKANISVDNNRSSHLLMTAELEGIICSGKSKGNKQTYALLGERIPKTKSLNKEEALATLAERYLSSHCPATLADFTWWSGLPVVTAKQALELVKPKFLQEKIGDQAYWLSTSCNSTSQIDESVHMLPAYDEFLISYKDRTASLSVNNSHASISTNGIFRPVIVINGLVIGIWRRTTAKDKVLVETAFFKGAGKAKKRAIQEAAMAYERFLGRKVLFQPV